MGHICPSSDARGLGADRRWRRRRDHVRNAKNTGGTNMHTSGWIRMHPLSSLYRALGLTGLIRLHMPRTACSMYACTEVYLYSALLSV